MNSIARNQYKTSSSSSPSKKYLGKYDTGLENSEKYSGYCTENKRRNNICEKKRGFYYSDRTFEYERAN